MSDTSALWTIPGFNEPEVDHSDDEDGYPWDLDRCGDLGNYEEENDED